MSASNQRVTSIPSTSLDAGDSVTFTVGKETFCPVKFHAFEVGPFSATVRVRDGEDPLRAIARARDAAQGMFDAEYQAKLGGFLGRVRDAAYAAEQRAGRG